MKTEQEQTKQMLKTLCDKFQCSAIDRSYMAKSCRQCEDIIEALHEAGYGDISEYKAEIEQLKAENYELTKKLEARLTCDFVKTAQKHAKIDVLNRVMTYINDKIENDYGDMSDSVKYLTINIDDFDDFIDELMAEVQDE